MKLTMQLKRRSYDIILKAGCLANLHQFTNVQDRKVFVLTDSGVPARYAQTIADQCPAATVYTIPQGEGSKCLKVYGQILQAMLDFGMDRKDLLVAVGGGACASELIQAAQAGCDTFVTADVKYNQFWDAQDLGVNLIDAGHFYTENPVVAVLAENLAAAFPEIPVFISKKHRDCMKFF